MSLLSASRLQVTLSGTPILKDLGFTIEPGSWTGILGPNGSGKTTLLKTVAGLIDFEGDLTLEDSSISSWAPRSLARRIAFVRQSHSLPFDFKVQELVLLGRSPHKSPLSTYGRRDLDLAKDALDQVDLTGLSSRTFSSLSGGEQQRVFLAQALVQEADMFLLDEPTTYLDVHHQFEFLQYVRSMVSHGRSVLAAFHDLELAARFSDHLIILDKGRIAATGSPQEVLTEYLLADVFRMKAHVYYENDGSLRIQYDAPIHRRSTES